MRREKRIFRQLLFAGALIPLFTLLSACSVTPKPVAVGGAVSAAAIPEGGSFLLISDVHFDQALAVSAYGKDTGVDLWKSFQAEVRDILASDPPPRFIVYLGDLPVHSDSATDEVLEDIGEVLRGLRTLAQSAPTPVPLLYLPGNNDSLWGDYCDFSDDDRVPEPPYTKDDGHSLDWPMINGGSCARVGSGAEACLLDSTHRLDGYYSAYPMKDHRLRVLMMNSVMFTGTTCFNSDHPWNDRKDEGDRQLAWLGDQLESARQNGEKVLIGMHIPPGKDLYCKDGEPHRGQMWQDPAQQKTFLDHVETYQPEIVGVLTSHTHMDEIRILHGSKGPVELAFSAPGISPNHSQNPGLKLVTFDADRELTDVTTYHTTLPLSASNGWQDHYTFRAAYSCTDADETLWDCAKRQSQAQLYNGLKQTLQVGRGQPTCDVSGLMEVDYPGT